MAAEAVYSSIYLFFFKKAQTCCLPEYRNATWKKNVITLQRIWLKHSLLNPLLLQESLTSSSKSHQVTYQSRLHGPFRFSYPEGVLARETEGMHNQ